MAYRWDLVHFIDNFSKLNVFCIPDKKICDFDTQIYFCIPESFNTNISQQLFDHKITFINSQDEHTDSKGDFVLKPRF